MIKEIRIQNMRSIKDAKVSFEKSGIEYRQKYIFNGDYVNPVTMYGDNGSGKSMFLYAIKQLVLLMNYEDNFTGSQSEAFPNILGFSKFADSKTGAESNRVIKTKVPHLSFTFLTKDNIEFVYDVDCITSSILRERLRVKNMYDNKPVLERVDEKYKVIGEKEESIRKTYSAIRLIGIEDYSDKNSNKSIIKRCFECMRDVIYIDSDENVFGYKFITSKTPTDIMLESDFVAKYVSEFSSLPPFKHIAKESQNGDKVILLDFGKNSYLPLGATSDGIIRQSHLIAALKASLEENDPVVVIDEINRSIHPLNIKSIVNEFVDKGVQLFFSSHDTSLLKYLRPDQIYFSYLKGNIESVYCRLNELHPNIREINNIESMYLKGIFDEELQECI